jgi:hypothetical protein
LLYYVELETFDEEATMFDWKLVLILTAACIPGIAVVVPRTLGVMGERLEAARVTGKKIPPQGMLVAVQGVQTLVLAAGAAVVGTALAGRTGLAAPFFSALAAGRGVGAVIKAQLIPALGVGAAGALVFLLLYYLVFRRLLDAASVQAMERLRMQNGIIGRVLYGGIVEEVLMRWGLMSLIAWLLFLIFGSSGAAVMWAAILVSGILFGLGHLPAYLSAGCRMGPVLLAAMLSLNLWAAVLFGWLFMSFGLVAAMIAHAMFHLVWYPFDVAFAVKPGGRQLEQEA